MPITATLAMVAAAAMAGVPLLNGFLSKEMFFAETLFIDAHPGVRIVVPVAATIAGALAVAYSARFIHDVFFNGEPIGLARTPHEPPRLMRVPVEVLVVVCVLVGVLPAVTIGPLLAIAAKPVVGGVLPEYSLALWHGFNRPLMMSIIALAAGVAGYFLVQRTINLHRVRDLPGIGKHAFDAGQRGLRQIAGALAGVLPYERLTGMLAWIVGAAIVAMAVPLLRDGLGLPGGPLRAIGMLDASTGVLGLGIFGIGVAAAVAATALYRRRLVAVILLGAVGLMVSLAFALMSAPDLALTQLLVEVVTVILMMLVLHYLPAESPPEPSRARQWRDAAIAVAAGGGIGAIAYAVMVRPFASIAPYYLERSLTEGGGTNVVNVVIVDFRGFDTLGEITVLGIAALVVGALLNAFRIPEGYRRPPPAADWNPLMLQVVTHALVPFAALVSVYLLLRGHNRPGGGFIAGLTLAAALVLARIAGGLPRPDRQRLPHSLWIAAGVALAALTGLASLALGYPFLTSTFGHPVLRVIGELPLASAALFDLGVYFAVVGATMLAIMAPGLLGEPRGHR
jgi:multicomponent K+:H+ antiporter subunit A